MKQLDDDTLISLYGKGETNAFETLYQRYRSQVFNYLYGLVTNREAAEDIFQETFMRLLKSLKRYRACDRFVSYLYRIAFSAAMDYLRKKGSMKELSLVEYEEKGISISDGFDGNESSTAQIAERNLEREAVRKAIAKLPLEQRQILLLREYGGLSFREISDLVGCPLNTALGRMHYAIRNLRKALEPEIQEQESDTEEKTHSLGGA
jgi:RNA polymerase sigma-70 factor (ECF subfamily)